MEHLKLRLRVGKQESQLNFSLIPKSAALSRLIIYYINAITLISI